MADVLYLCNAKNVDFKDLVEGEKEIRNTITILGLAP